MYSPKAEQEFQGYPPLPPPPQQIATGYPLLQNPYAQPQVQYVQPPPPQFPDVQLQYLQPSQPPPPPPYPSPPPQNGNPVRPTEWSSDLCACTEDLPHCCFTCCFPCITFGQIAEIVDEGSPPCAVSGAIYGMLCFMGFAFAGMAGLFCFTGFAWCYSCVYRTKMRAKFNLAQIPCADCLVHGCCDPCALCQEYKELKHRGYDPALGWTGNLQRQQRGMFTATAPPVNPTMEK